MVANKHGWSCVTRVMGYFRQPKFLNKCYFFFNPYHGPKLGAAMPQEAKTAPVNLLKVVPWGL